MIRQQVLVYFPLIDILFIFLLSLKNSPTDGIKAALKLHLEKYSGYPEGSTSDYKQYNENTYNISSKKFYIYLYNTRFNPPDFLSSMLKYRCSGKISNIDLKQIDTLSEAFGFIPAIYW